MKSKIVIKKEMSEHTFGMLLLSPTIILLLVFIAFPICYSIHLSFQNVILSRPYGNKFVGLQNYINMLRNPIFLASLWKTLYFSVSFLFCTLIIGMIVALVLNNDFYGKNFVITCLLIPWAVPNVVNGLIWKWIYDGNFGILNAILLKTGIIDSYKFWFAETPFIGIFLISIAYTWKLMPFVALLFLAALQTIPKDFYDAAKVDGASAWQRFIHITIPSLRYTMIIVLILQTVQAIKVFDIIIVLTRGGPGDKTMLTYYYIYRTAFNYLSISSAAAGAYIITIVIIILSIIYYKLFKGGAD